MNTIKTVLVDDHELFRDGIEILLGLHPGIELLASVSNARKLFDYLKTNPTPDLFLLDINLPGTSGIELARQLTAEYGIQKFVFLTSNSAKMFMDAALKTGARGFLTKECSKEELVRGIEQVYQGEFFFGKDIEQTLYQGYVGQLSNQDTGLTDREMQVLRHFANGFTYQEVADALSISRKTVEVHKKAIYEKLQLRNQTDLVKYAIKHHIIEL